MAAVQAPQAAGVIHTDFEKGAERKSFVKACETGFT